MLRAPIERAHMTRFHSLLVGVYISALFWLSPKPIKIHAFLIQLILLPTALPKVITTKTKMVGPETVIFWSFSHLLSNSDSRRKINATLKTNEIYHGAFVKDSWSNRKGGTALCNGQQKDESSLGIHLWQHASCYTRSPSPEASPFSSQLLQTFSGFLSWIITCHFLKS